MPAPPADLTTTVTIVIDPCIEGRHESIPLSDAKNAPRWCNICGAIQRAGYGWQYPAAARTESNP